MGTKQITVTDEQAQMIANIVERKRRSLRSFMRQHGNDLGSRFYDAAMKAERDLSDLMHECGDPSYLEGPNT